MRLAAAVLQRLQTLRDDHGAAAVEYGLLVALIAVALGVGASALGIGINDGLSWLASAITGGAS